MTGWLIAGGIVALLFLILLLPVTLRLAAGEKTEVTLRYTFYRKRLFPAEEREKKPKDMKGAPREEKPAPEPKEKKSIFETLDMLSDLLAAIDGRLRGCLVVSSLALSIRIAEEDAAQTAIQYGRVSAYVHTALALARNLIPIRKARINITPDFLRDSGSGSGDFSLELSLRIIPLVIVWAALRIAGAFLAKQLRSGKRQSKTKQLKQEVRAE